MAVYLFRGLETTYKKFLNPVAVVKVNGKEFSKNKANLILSGLDVDLSCGFEASCASFCIYNSFEKETGEFRFEEIKEYIFLGSSVEISLGYGESVKTVFVGFIARVNFICGEEIPCVKVTAMDVKGIMMANNYAKQLLSYSFSDAVREIFQKNMYITMQERSIIRDIHITDTPDKAKKTSDKEISQAMEMVCESDYEFVVKAAKKFNYEFFTECGCVIFRKAKANQESLIEIGSGSGLKNFDLEYDITGLTETIQARGFDAGKAKIIQAKKKLNNTISKGNKAKPFIKKSEMVYLDSTITSQEEAENRVDYLMEEMLYRFGALDAECIGLPELKPGYFIRIKGFGKAVDNRFYLMNVRHVINENEGFTSKIKGKASDIAEKSIGGGSGIGVI